ncbi:MAG TPA: HAMP domain-containing protein [Deltaproteobacteria bacterium]|nr:HAMP domain-containing protein [Deltaproteobacteria bacterium]
MRTSIRTRLTIATIGLALATAALALGTVYFITVAGVERHTRRDVQRELDSLVERWKAGGLDELVKMVNERVADPEHGGFAYLIAQEERLRIAGNVREWPRDEGTEDGQEPVSLEIRKLDTWVMKPVQLESITLGRHHLLVGRDSTDDATLIADLGKATLASLALVSFLTVAIGLGVSRNLLGRVESMRKKIARIIDGNRQERVEVSPHDDEFDELAAQFNRLLDENDRLLAQALDATNNIAHDLRTPLQRMHGRLEAALTARDTTPENRELLEALSADTHQLLDTFNGLLQLARLEGHELRRSMRPIEVDKLIEDVVDLYGPLAEDAGLELRVSVEPDLRVTADRQLLGQALANLIDNAMKYAPDGRSIEVEARRRGDAIEISVSDHGPGIPAPDRERVLDRLVRLEPSRSVPGTGLGLSFVAAVARLHGGTLELVDNDPGLRCTLHIPDEEGAKTPDLPSEAALEP